MPSAPPSSPPVAAPTSPAPEPLKLRGDGPAPRVFRQGAHPPVAIRWYGITSLFGHFRNFIARAIASESVDSRDWMRPLGARELLESASSILGVSPRDVARAGSLVEALGRPLWIDFVADTGDDRDVSRGVATVLFARHVVEVDGVQRSLPRGDLLVFGGDTAYPVATVDEIQRRVIAPWNEVLDERKNERSAPDPHGPRVLLGIPGNHDWYDGLDGFARMFRRGVYGPETGVSEPPPSQPYPNSVRGRISRGPTRASRNVGLVARSLHLDEALGLVRLLGLWGKGIAAFFRGVGVGRQRRLHIDGYEPIQETSYWVLPLTGALDLWGVDRQLGGLDYRQRAFFRARREQLTADTRIAFVAPDPALAFGSRHRPGQRMLDGCGLSLDHDPLLYLTGDLHHYERRPNGRAMHVIAGGGGAFLHGTRIRPSKNGPPARAYPDAAMTKQLVLQVPWKLMVGRGGLLVHAALFLMASGEIGTSWRGASAFTASSFLVSVGITVGLYLIAAYQGAKRWRVAAITLPFGAAIGGLPWTLTRMLPHVVPPLAGSSAVAVVSAFLGALIFGFFLVVLALTGIEHQQAFAVLGHPGFKHFVRMCVHPDGRVEGWVIGKDDMLVPGPPSLIDTFEW